MRFEREKCVHVWGRGRLRSLGEVEEFERKRGRGE